MKKLTDYEKAILHDRRMQENDLKERYYFWEWNKSTGWRTLGRTDGYHTIEELKLDNKHNLKHAQNWRIMVSKFMEGKEIDHNTKDWKDYSF